MDQPLISIIVPVYNVEKYLPYCMESILNQTYYNIEIILVDDGSTDNSGNLCDVYASKDARINVIHKENKGLSSARNVGMKQVKGQFFTFIDSDDYVRIDYVSRLYQYIIQDKTEMVVCSCKKIVGKVGYNVIPDLKIKHIIYNRDEIQKEMLSRRVPMYAVSKLFNKSMIEKIIFPEGKLYEDMPTIWEAIKYANKVTYADDPIYFYRQRTESIVNEKYTHRRMDQLYFTEQILQELPKNTTIYYTGMSRCFFAATDNYSLVTKDYPEDKRYLKYAIKKYRYGVLRDLEADILLKVLALISYVTPYLVRLIGKAYKLYQTVKAKINYMKLK